MASIETRTLASGDRRLVVRWREAGRASRYRSKSFPSTRQGRTDAQAFRSEIERRLRIGPLADEITGSKQTLMRFVVDEWWPKYATPRLAPATRSSYEYVLDKWLIPYLGDLRLRDVTRQTINGWVVGIRRDGAGAPTANRALAILQGILERAREWGKIQSNPAADVKKLAHRRDDEIRARTAEEVEEIRVRLARQDAALVSVLAYVGLRPAEAFALKWRDVLDEKRHARARLFAAGTKTARARRHPEVPPVIGRELRDLHVAAGQPSIEALVFPSSNGGELSRQNWRQRVWKTALDGNPEKKIAAIAYFRPYDLRHTAATLLIYEGRTPNEVAQQLGHADPGFTVRTYAHVFDDARGKRIPINDAITRARSSAQRERTA